MNGHSMGITRAKNQVSRAHGIEFTDHLVPHLLLPVVIMFLVKSWAPQMELS